MGYPSINRDYCGDGNYNLSARTQAIKWIVVHYTGTTAAARNNCQYFRSGNRNASADWFIDDSGIYAFNPDVRKYYSWHCGGGTAIEDRTNSRAVGIEVVSDGADFTDTEKNLLRSLVQALMDDFGVDAAHVIRHYDCHTGHKACPAPYTPNGGDPSGNKWRELHSYITTKEAEDMSPSECWNYLIGEGVPGKNDTPAWVRLGYIHQDSATLRAVLCRTKDETGSGHDGDIVTRINWIDYRVREQEKKLNNIEALLKKIDEKME